MNIIKNLTKENIVEDYQININDVITGQKINLSDFIDYLMNRISSLESKNRELFDRVNVLEEENLSTTNELYRLENSLETRIDILSGEYFLQNNNHKKPTSTTVNSQYTEDELNAMCDKAASDEEKEKCREYNLREAEYYNKRVEIDYASINQPSPHQIHLGWKDVSGEEFDKMFPSKDHRKNTTKKWKVTIDGEYNLILPDDLLNQIGWKEGDTIDWIDNRDGSFKLQKIDGNHPEKYKTYDEMIADGYTMTADGFWINES